VSKTNIVGISGHTASGKDTVADCFVEEGYVKVSFSDPLKRFCSVVFDFSEQQLFGESKQRNTTDKRYFKDSQQWAIAEKEILAHGFAWIKQIRPDAYPGEALENYESLLYWFSKLKEKHPKLSPRVAMQLLGTEWGREKIGVDVWVRPLHDTALKLLHGGGQVDVHYQYDKRKGIFKTDTPPKYAGVVVPDVRFKNELDFCNRYGKAIIKVVRDETDEFALKTGVKQHPSEKEQKEFTSEDFSAILSNDASLGKLKEDAKMLAVMYKE